MSTSLGLGLGDPQLGLQRVGSATRARLVPGATCWPTSTGTCSQHAVRCRRATAELVDAALRSVDQRPELVDAGLLRLELGANVVLGNLDALLLELVTRRQRIRLDRGLLEDQVGDEAVLGEVLVDFLSSRACS